MNDLIELIKKGEYNFDGKEWKNVSSSAKDLINKLLLTDPKKRFFPAKALKHKWIKNLEKEKANPFSRKSNLFIQGNLKINRRRLTKTNVMEDLKRRGTFVKRGSFNYDLKHNALSNKEIFTETIKKLEENKKKEKEEESDISSSQDDLSDLSGNEEEKNEFQ